MPEQPLVSIILPTYRRAAWFESALQSALEQTYKNLEILVMDDGADEATRAVVDFFKDQRIKYQCNLAPLGILGNGLAGLRAANGKYVAILNDDDAWEADFLEKLIAPLEHDCNLVLSFANHYWVNEAGDIEHTTTLQADRYFGRDTLTAGRHQPFQQMAIIDQSIPVACACVIRRSAIDWNAFPSEVGGAYDLWIAYLASRDGGSAYYTNERLAYYRVHNSSGSSTRHLQNATERLFAADAMLQDPQLACITELIKTKHHERTKGMAMALVKSHHFEMARPYLVAGLKHRFEVKTMLALGLTYMPSLLFSKLVQYHDKRHSWINSEHRTTFSALRHALITTGPSPSNGLPATGASVFRKPLSSLIAEESDPKV